MSELHPDSTTPSSPLSPPSARAWVRGWVAPGLGAVLATAAAWLFWTGSDASAQVETLGAVLLLPVAAVTGFGSVHAITHPRPE